MRHALKLFAFLILPTQGVSAWSGAAAGLPPKSSAPLIWIQGDKPASREIVALRPMQFPIAMNAMNNVPGRWNTWKTAQQE
jgi:hypothetical protein